MNRLTSSCSSSDRRRPGGRRESGLVCSLRPRIDRLTEPTTDGGADGRRPDRLTRAIDALTFDEALAELQRTVAELEAGGQPLEASIALYERGVALQAAARSSWAMPSCGSNSSSPEPAVDRGPRIDRPRATDDRPEVPAHRGSAPPWTAADPPVPDGRPLLGPRKRLLLYDGPRVGHLSVSFIRDSGRAAQRGPRAISRATFRLNRNVVGS